LAILQRAREAVISEEKAAKSHATVFGWIDIQLGTLAGVNSPGIAAFAAATTKFILV
jgi:hypothetical protein